MRIRDHGAAVTGGASLLDPPARSVLEPTGTWLTSLLTGSIATSLCVIAVATLGIIMLSGRLPLRRGAQVLLGCFVLLGAPTLAAGLRMLGETINGSGPARVTISPDAGAEPEQPLPPADFDPYEGASLRSQ